MTERIARTEAFLREKLKESPYFAEHPEAGEYRLEHSFRVARIGAAIAQAEGMDEELMTMACLLHDVSYCRAMLDQDTWKDHGRSSAHIARPFLESLDLPEMVIGEMCYGIAIHVDDAADFPGERTAFAGTIQDADNIDRFDVYRVYETLENMSFSKLSLAEKRSHVERTRQRLKEYLDLPFATAAATELWQERIGFYLDFYRRLGEQLASSTGFTGEEEPVPTECPQPDSRLLGPAGSF